MTRLVLAVVVCAFCAYRAARVVAVDSITLGFRRWLFRVAWVWPQIERTTWPRRPLTWLYALLSCPYCIGFWFSLATWWAWHHIDGSHMWIAAIAVAGVQTAIQARTSE